MFHLMRHISYQSCNCHLMVFLLSHKRRTVKSYTLRLEIMQTLHRQFCRIHFENATTFEQVFLHFGCLELASKYFPLNQIA